jgi:putative GTP pyrophosphokinase
MPISREEIARWEEHLKDPSFVRKVKKFQKVIYGIFEDQRIWSDNRFIRFVHPRPDVKSLKSVVTKISRKRKTCPDYDIDSIEDLVGIKVICPFMSCAEAVMSWMFHQPSFSVKPNTIEEAWRTTETGYRGWHFVAEPSGELIKVRPIFVGAKCEIQVKTMLQEAGDAQTHDITYKQEGLVDKRLIAQLKAQGTILAQHDKQSEIIRQMIGEVEEKEKEHKTLAATTYLCLTTSSGIFDYIRAHCNIDIGRFDKEVFPLSFISLTSVNRFIDCYIKEKKVDKDLIKLLAYIALNQEDIEQEEMALTLAQRFLSADSQNPDAEDTLAGFFWALNRFEEAIEYGKRAIKKAQYMKKDVSPYQNNYCYWVTEAVHANIDVKKVVKKQVLECSDLLVRDHPDDPKYLDTRAFVKIVFGTTAEEIKNGQALSKKARELATRTGSPETLELCLAFNVRHEKLANSLLAERTLS